MAKAIWNGVTLAESDKTQIVEGNVYFPPESLAMSYFRRASKTSVCAWKGTAHYYDIVVGSDVNAGAAWYYPHPSPLAEKIAGYVAFWNGVEVSNDAHTP